MDKREAKRRARVMASRCIVSAVEGGWQMDGYTDDGSEREIGMLEAALFEVADEVAARLPSDWGFEPGMALRMKESTDA